VIIEVPHARDFLLSTLDHEGFRKFTLRSDHCILHTRESLTRFMEFVGFKRVSIRSVQRYPISNHLGWLSRNSPGGHTSDLSILDSDSMHVAYESALLKLMQPTPLWQLGLSISRKTYDLISCRSAHAKTALLRPLSCSGRPVRQSRLQNRIEVDCRRLRRPNSCRCRSSSRVFQRKQPGLRHL